MQRIKKPLKLINKTTAIKVEIPYQPGKKETNSTRQYIISVKTKR